MATGDQSDILSRLKGLLPPWFGGVTPILDALLSGAEANLSWGYSLLQFTKLQTRIKTATGGFLDLIAWDFFGSRFVRRTNETDASWQGRILPEILRERGTRKGVIQALKDLTGRTPVVTETTNPLDCGSYGGPFLGYGAAGHYGTLLMPNQAFITAYRPSTSGIPEIPGYSVTSTASGHVLGGYGVTGKYAGISEVVGPVTDLDIFNSVAQTQAAGVIIWTQIAN